MQDAMGSHIVILQLLSTQPLFLTCHSSVPCCIKVQIFGESSVVVPSLNN